MNLVGGNIHNAPRLGKKKVSRKKHSIGNHA